MIVDVDKLFSLAQDAEIDKTSTVLLVKNRNIIERLTDNLTIDLVQEKIKLLEQM